MFYSKDLIHQSYSIKGVKDIFLFSSKAEDLNCVKANTSSHNTYCILYYYGMMVEIFSSMCANYSMHIQGFYVKVNS